jgi:hypothetical protein
MYNLLTLEVPMNVFSIVLFIHVLSAIALFIALALEGAILVRLRSAGGLEQSRFFVRISRRLGIIYGPAFAGILFGGIYLALQLGSHAAWIPLALGATLLIMLVGGLVTGRTMSRLNKALSEDAASFESISTQARSKSLVLSHGFRAGLAVGIVFLMSATPSLIPSITALVVASLAGVLLATRVRLTSRVQDDCGWRGKSSPAATQRS